MPIELPAWKESEFIPVGPQRPTVQELIDIIALCQEEEPIYTGADGPLTPLQSLCKTAAEELEKRIKG